MIYFFCKFCPHCGAPNSKFDEKVGQLLRSGARAGWKQAPEPTLSKEASAAGGSGDDHAVLHQLNDLMKELRQRKRKSEESVPASASVSDSTGPTVPCPAVQDASKESSAQPAQVEEESSDRDLDLKLAQV